MKKSDELKLERTAKVEAQQAIVEKAKAEKRDVATLNEEEATKFDALNDEIGKLDKAIERQLQVEKNETILASRAAAPVTTDVVDGETREKTKVYGRVSLGKALRQASPDFRGGLDGAEKEMHEIGAEQQRSVKGSDFKNVSLSIPYDYLYRADQQTVTQDSGNYGGNLVQDDTLRVVENLTPSTFLEGLGATMLTGLSGGDVPLIANNDFDMAFMAETAAITVQKKEFTGPSLSPNRAGGAVDISNQLLLQASPSVDTMITNKLRAGFGRLLNQSCIEGTTYITGLATYTGVNTAAATSAVVASWTNMVELQTLIFEDNSTRDSLGYIIHPRIEGKLKTVAKDSGSGQFVIQGGMLDIYKYVATSLITAGWDGTDTYPVFFGDFSQMYIGQWGAINVTVNPYSADLNNSLRLVLNTYADMEIVNPKAFARNIYIAETASS